MLMLLQNKFNIIYTKYIIMLCGSTVYNNELHEMGNTFLFVIIKIIQVHNKNDSVQLGI